MYIKLTKKITFSAVQILALGFSMVILLGAIILSLPISSKSGEFTPFLDSLFTSTSAVCVTGLITLNTAAHWNYFGKTVIIILIQIGGLGFMSFTTLFALMVKKKITLRERLLIQEAMNTFGIQGLVRMIRYILAFTFSVEMLGALLLSTQFIPKFGFLKGIYYSIWHSISAFCNAGFDLFGDNLVGYANNKTVILTIAALIVIGGLGFTVWSELYNYKGYKKLSLHSKVVIMITAILLIGGAILMFIFEYNNPNTLKYMSFGDKLTNAFFASATTRTAGFNSVSTADMTLAGKFLTILLMFVGGSPGSTAGGIKTATFGIVVLTLISIIRGREDTEVFKKRISKELVYKAFAVLFIGFGIVVLGTLILAVTEPGFSLEYILYEVTSAFATVGLTLGLTPYLSVIGKIIIIITMYLGRVGPMTVVLALANRKKPSAYKYPEDKILIG